MTAPALRCTGVVHVYRVAGTDVAALRGIDLEVQPGQSVAVLGPSGSGKSTLLQIASGVVRPSAGRVEVFGQDLASAPPRLVDEIRGRALGVVLQGPESNLVLHETAAANVDVAAAGRAARATGLGILAARRLEADPRPVSALGPSEQQVAALAVAVCNRPALLLADEPTSRLDRPARDRLLDLMLDTVRDAGSALMVVTHDEAVARRMDRTIHIGGGRVSEEVTDRGRYAVLGADRDLQLPAHLLGERWVPGALIEVRRSAGEIVLRLSDGAGDE